MWIVLPHGEELWRCIAAARLRRLQGYTRGSKKYRKKKHQATDKIACPENPFNFIHSNPAVHAGEMAYSRMSYI
jgi:hypothetical protein